MAHCLLDDDECAGQGIGHNCHEHSSCSNTAGSFKCVCDAGYSGDGVTCIGIIGTEMLNRIYLTSPGFLE